jgi:hypothetical protein
MSDFFLPTLFVLPDTVTIPTTGSTDTLLPGQFGFYNQAYAAVTAATINNSKYIYMAQGRIENLPNMGTKRTDKIYKNRQLTYYKVPAVSAIQQQITEVSGFTAGCEESLVLTLRLFSNYIELAYFNGLTRSFPIETPCCECGADPCAEVDPEGIVDQFVEAVNADPLVSQYVVASKTGTGVDAVLVLTGQPVTRYTNACSPTAFTYEYDKLRFDTFAYKNPDTTQDFVVDDACDLFATVEVTQTSTYQRGSGDEIFELEKKYFGYHSTQKSLFRNIEYDGGFVRYSNPALFYDTYYIRQTDPDNLAWELSEQYDQMIIIAAPVGQTTTLEAILTAWFGAPDVITVTTP